MYKSNNSKPSTSFQRAAAATAVSLFFLALLPAVGAVADEEVFELSKLSVADRVLDIITDDLDNDGLKDIVIIHLKGLPPDETRWISIFWHEENGSFSTAADQSWSVDTAAVIIDVGDVYGGAEKEIVYLTPTGVRYHAIEDGFYEGESSLLFEVSGLAVFPSKQSIPHIDFVRDWNDDGLEDVAVFKFEGLSIHRRNRDGVFDADSTISIELRTGMRGFTLDMERDVTVGLSARYNFPDIRLMDFNADGRRDLITTDEEKVAVYYRNAESFSPRPDYSIRFDVKTQKEKIEEMATVLTTISDINDDGYADAIVTKQTAKGLSNFRGVLNIFHGGPDGYMKDPGQVIISEGTASAVLFIRDVNGDDRLDFILPSVKISISAIIRFLITRSLPIYLNIFLLDQDGRYPDRPDFTKEVKFKIDFSGDSDEQAMDIDGDYNGDKRKDFVFATDSDELSIYLGITDGGDDLFSKKPVAKIRADAFGELSSPDLNGDGYSDMIIYYEENKERKGMVEVLINLKRIQ